jgi:hypothetical protein
MTAFRIGAMACALALLASPGLAASPSAAKAPTITQSLEMVSYGSPKISLMGGR